MLNKILIPAALLATVVIAGIFAFMPIEKASTVHSTLTTNTNSQDRSMYFRFNQSLLSAYSSTGITLIPAETGTTIAGSFTISATPNNSTKGQRTLECGLVDTTAGGDDIGTNATTGSPQSGTLSSLASGEGIIMQINSDLVTGSDIGGVCEATIFIDSMP